MIKIYAAVTYLADSTAKGLSLVEDRDVVGHLLLRHQPCRSGTVRTMD